VRARTTPGTVLLTVEAPRPHGGDTIVLASDGRTCEHVDPRRTYGRIVIPGALGPMVFQLRDGRLSVVEASCRHALCRKMGARASGRILCAPNRVVATLPGSQARLDAWTG
jgi:hypothetical protein